jgi:hypothetical protein
VILLLAAGPADANSQERVTVITDSVGGALLWLPPAKAALTHGLNVDIEARTCRRLVDPGCPAEGDDHPESTLAAIERLGPALGSTVVIDVGYNDVAEEYAAGIDQVVRALAAAGVRHVVWVTLAERQASWTSINEAIRTTPGVVVADWASASAGQDWFVDDAHLNWIGGIALARFLRPVVLQACGAGCVAPPVFCGLAWTANGFDPVRAVAEVGCAEARSAVVAIERGRPGDWTCSRAVGATYELDCRRGWQELQVLERAPVPVTRSGATATLANWSFRLDGAALEGRSGAGPWHLLIGRAPYCVPDAPREVLVALRLRPTTPSGGCFERR